MINNVYRKAKKCVKLIKQNWPQMTPGSQTITYGFFPVLLLMCLFFVWFLVMNSLPHIAQWFLVSLVWLFMRLFMWLLENNPLPHRAQWYEISLIWIFMCCFVWFQYMKPLPHRGLWYVFYPAWLCMCLFRCFLVMNSCNTGQIVMNSLIYSGFNEPLSVFLGGSWR